MNHNGRHQDPATKDLWSPTRRDFLIRASSAAAVAVGGLVAGIPLTADTAHAAPSPQQPIRRLRGGMRAEESELLRLLNDARAHPEKYPPNGNPAGATMVSCGPPFKYSKELLAIALAHNRYLASQPIDWVNTYPNMHTGPNGKPVGAPGEPMDQAGYRSYRAEIVATGFPTPIDVIRFWMQDDERFQWGHRNLILNCTIHEAGPGYTQGGPGNHYWTVDMGTR